MSQNLRYKSSSYRGIFSLAGMGAISVVLILALSVCLISCQSASPQITTGEGGGPIDFEGGDQVANNPWPYVIIALGLTVIFFAYLYFSKKYIGFGRK